MVNSVCQFGFVWNKLKSRILDTPMRDFLDYLNKKTTPSIWVTTSDGSPDWIMNMEKGSAAVFLPACPFSLSNPRVLLLWFSSITIKSNIGILIKTEDQRLSRNLTSLQGQTCWDCWDVQTMGWDSYHLSFYNISMNLLLPDCKNHIL